MLVVEDDPILSESLSRILGEDFFVAAATSSAEALALLASGASYDVVLCDVDMPQISGVELLERVFMFAPAVAARFLFVTRGQLGVPLPEWAEKRKLMVDDPINILPLCGLGETPVS